MVNKIMFYIGLNDKDAKVQKIDTLAAGDIVERVFVSHGVDGATLSSGRGIYKHDSGDIVTENTIIVQVYDFGGVCQIDAICQDLKQLLNQESIAVEQIETNSALY